MQQCTDGVQIVWQVQEVLFKLQQYMAATPCCGTLRYKQSKENKTAGCATRVDLSEIGHLQCGKCDQQQQQVPSCHVRAG